MSKLCVAFEKKDYPNVYLQMFNLYCMYINWKIGVLGGFINRLYQWLSSIKINLRLNRGCLFFVFHNCAVDEEKLFLQQSILKSQLPTRLLYSLNFAIVKSAVISHVCSESHCYWLSSEHEMKNFTFTSLVEFAWITSVLEQHRRMKIWSIQ